MTHNLTQQLRSLVLSGQARNYKALRDSMWLYITLLLLGEGKGELALSFQSLSELTGIQESTLRSWAGLLRKEGWLRWNKEKNSGLVRFQFRGQRKGLSPSNLAMLSLASSLRNELEDHSTSLSYYIYLIRSHPLEHLLYALDEVKRVENTSRKRRIEKFKSLLTTS